MAEEKKPKIDLKARLGKTAMGGATPAPPGGVPVPTPVPGVNNVPAAVPSPSTPNRAQIPVGPPPAFGKAVPAPALDPSNPLAAAIAPARSVAPAAAPAQPQRIEVDEMAVQVARRGARKQGLVAGLVLAAVVGVVGFIGGGAQAESKARTTSVAHAKSLAADVQKAHDQLKTLAEKVEAGRNTLVKDKKFPDNLARELGDINVDFDGGKLAGVRFSGFSQDTTTGLIEFITAVQTVNDRKNALISLLGRLQKPLTEKLTQKPQVTFIAAIDRDGARNPYATLMPLVKPLELSANMPAEFGATNPRRQNVNVPKLTNLDKGGAAYVTPDSFEAACPSETMGQAAQLGSQLGKIVTDIRGEKGSSSPDAPLVNDKPGLLERAEKLVVALNKVQ